MVGDTALFLNQHQHRTKSKMESLLKKFIYTGIGLVSITRERLQKNIDNLVSDQKLSKEEGRRIVDDVMDKTEAKRGELESQFKKVTEEVMDKFNFATSKELEALKRRVEALEIRLAKVNTPVEDSQDNIAIPDTSITSQEETTKKTVATPGKKKPNDPSL